MSTEPRKVPLRPIDTSNDIGLESKPYAVRARSIAIGALLIPLNCLWIVRMERVLPGPYPSSLSLFANVVLVLFILMGINHVVRRWKPRLAWSQGELLTVYTMLAISTGLAGLDGVGTICQIIPHGAWFATTVNGWDRLLDSFPSWLVIKDKSIIAGHYVGHASFFDPNVLRAWATPIIAWTLLITTLLFVLQCINVLHRPTWSDHERLTFPIAVLPLQMTEDGVGTHFFRNRLMWLGFSLAAAMNVWNELATLIPTLPLIPLGGQDLHYYFVAKPWNAITWFPITFYPVVIGLAFLLPVDLLFSCVFFFLFWNAQTVAANAFDFNTKPGFPFIPAQGFGAIIGLFVYYLWTGKRRYSDVWRSLLNKNTNKDSTEALSPRTALLGIVFGLLGVVAFCRLAGASWWVIAAFLFIYIASAVVVTRIRAELGPSVHDFHFMGAASMLPNFGTDLLSRSDMAFLTLTFGLSRAHRSDTMPIGLEGLHMANVCRFNARRMFVAVLIATFLGCIGTFWAYEYQAYQLGAAAHFSSGYGMAGDAMYQMVNMSGNDSLRRLNASSTTAMGIGLLTTLILFALRFRLPWFPLHPIGYAISSSWAIHLIWFPELIALVIKATLLYIAGPKLYRRAVPFFLGMVLGECALGSLWGLLSLSFGIPAYNFFGA